MSSQLPELKKLTLPTLKWKYDALEPYISEQINEIHHSKHHKAYVDGYNNTVEKLVAAIVKEDVKQVVELQKAQNFFSGGYINHVLFFNNLAPKSQGGGNPPSTESAFYKRVIEQYGSLENLQGITNGRLASIQGSGWAFIVKNPENGGELDVVTTANQDTVLAPLIPLVAIDAWEHAYYLQYQNVKGDYFKAIWNVIDWGEAEKRYDNGPISHY